MAAVKPRVSRRPITTGAEEAEEEEEEEDFVLLWLTSEALMTLAQ